MTGRTFWRGFGAVLVVALVVRVVVIVATPDFRPVTDATDYDRHAVSLVQTGSYPQTALAPAGGPTAFRPPLFPLALAAVYEVRGVSSPQRRWQAGRAMEAVLGTLAVGLIALIGLRLWGRRTGLVAGAVAAVYPPLILIGSSLLSESLYVPLVLGAVLAALVHRDSARRWRWAVLAGALLGLATLTRANGAALVIPVAFLVWSERPRWSWRALRAPLTVAIVAGLALVPWIVRNAIVLHEFEPLSTESGYALAGTYDADARAHTPYPALWIPPYALPDLRPIFTDRTLDEAAVSSRLRRHALDYIKEHPTYPLEVGFWNGARLLNLTGPGVERWAAQYEGYPAWLAVTSVFAFWVVAALGLVGALTRAARRAPLAFWACPLVIVLSCTFIYGLTRYRAPADPWVVLLATLGLLAAVRRVRERARPVARAEIAAGA